jgi:dimethylhistidine N-methyltransferase
MQRLFEAGAAPVLADAFREEVLEGLSKPQKWLPSRYFYDARGSELFEEITRLPEYYPTRTEIALLKSYAVEIAQAVPRGAAVVEFGSGSSLKTELLLEALDRPASYIPIEISETALYPAAARIREKFPGLEVCPILGGFHDLDRLKLPAAAHARVGFFPGSTIGNLTPPEANRFLTAARGLLGTGAVFVIGADLQKPLEILLPAYDDKAGITAAFNRNILIRINRELEGTFKPAWFEHVAIYNAFGDRVEMHLKATRAHSALAAGRRFYFRQDETIHTENSYKYTLAGFEALAAGAGWRSRRVWTDENNLFSVHMLG